MNYFFNNFCPFYKLLQILRITDFDLYFYSFINLQCHATLISSTIQKKVLNCTLNYSNVCLITFFPHLPLLKYKWNFWIIQKTPLLGDFPYKIWRHSFCCLQRPCFLLYHRTRSKRTAIGMRRKEKYQP